MKIQIRVESWDPEHWVKTERSSHSSALDALFSSDNYPLSQSQAHPIQSNPNRFKSSWVEWWPCLPFGFQAASASATDWIRKRNKNRNRPISDDREWVCECERNVFSGRNSMWKWLHQSLSHFSATAVVVFGLLASALDQGKSVIELT